MKKMNKNNRTFCQMIARTFVENDAMVEISVEEIFTVTNTKTHYVRVAMWGKESYIGTFKSDNMTMKKCETIVTNLCDILQGLQ